jgi:pilus assembly protein CpaB
MLALITSSLIYRFLKIQSTRKTIVTVPVVVTNSDITARKVIRPEQVGIRYVRSDAIRGDVCSSLEQVVGKAALVSIEKGSAVRPTDIGQPTAKLGLAYAIPSYMRAITVAVDDVSGLAGFLKPGDHVDVIAAFENNQRSAAKTILQDVELLALGKSVGEEKATEKSGRPTSFEKTTATLIVTPKEAERLVLADTQGKLRLVLRSPGDMVRVMSAGVSGTNVTGLPEGNKASTPAPKPTNPAKRQITVGSKLPRMWRPVPQIPRKEFNTSLAPAPLITTEIKAEPAKEIQIIRGNVVESVKVEEAK